jgi:hypothetical protein
VLLQELKEQSYKLSTSDRLELIGAIAKSLQKSPEMSVEVYAKVKALLIEEQNNQFLQDMYLPIMETFGKEGWDDPAMDIYNDLDPRRQS